MILLAQDFRILGLGFRVDFVFRPQRDLPTDLERSGKHCRLWRAVWFIFVHLGPTE